MRSNNGGNSLISKVATRRPISLSDEAAPTADMERLRRGRSISLLDEVAPAAETWSAGNGVRGEAWAEARRGGCWRGGQEEEGYHGPIAVQLANRGRTFTVRRSMGEADHKVILTLRFCYLDQIEGSWLICVHFVR